MEKGINSFLVFAKKTLKNFREVKEVTSTGFVAHVTVDLSGIQVPWLVDRLSSIAGLWKSVYPEAAMNVVALDGNYIGRFPLDSVAAVLGSGVVGQIGER